MPHDHHGNHHHIDPAYGDRKVALAVAVNLGLTAAQFVAGLVSGSLAMIADAVHNLSDALSLLIALVARRIARRGADARMTFGYGRAEMVAALVNYTTLAVIALWLVWEGVARLIEPQPVAGWIIVIVAGLALIVDLVTAALTYRMAQTSANIRAAFLHNLADALGSVGVIIAGAAILLFDWWIVDPIVTLAIAAYILWQVWLGAPRVIAMLMLGAPPGMDTLEVLAKMRNVSGVVGVHHLHVWEVQEGEAAVEAHVVITAATDAQSVRMALEAMLEAQFDIGHAMLVVEPEGDACENAQSIGHT